MQENERTKLLARAMSYCARSEHSRLEVERKIIQWSTSPLQANEIASLLQTLVDGGYIDDERYTRALLHDRKNFSIRGPIRIRMELREKGISASLIDKYIETVSTDEWIETLVPYVQQKAPGVRGRSDYERRQKLLRTLYQRGFPFDLASQAIDRAGIAGDDEPDLYW